MSGISGPRQTTLQEVFPMEVLVSEIVAMASLSPAVALCHSMGLHPLTEDTELASLTQHALLCSQS